MLYKIIGPYFAYISYFYLFFSFFGAPNILSNKIFLASNTELLSNVFCLRNPFFAKIKRNLDKVSSGHALVWEKSGFYSNFINDMQRSVRQNYSNVKWDILKSYKISSKQFFRRVRRKKKLSRKNFKRRHLKILRELSLEEVNSGFIGVSAWSIFNSIVFLDRNKNYTADSIFNSLKETPHLEKTVCYLLKNFYLKAKNFK